MWWRELSLAGLTAVPPLSQLAVGSLVHVVATVLGLSVLFGDSPLAYEVGKISAALYLIYLGVRYFISQNSELETNVRLPTQSLNQVFRESILVEVTNPKTALFFLALLPQFVVPEAGFAAPQLLILGLTNSHSLRNTLWSFCNVLCESSDTSDSI